MTNQRSDGHVHRRVATATRRAGVAAALTLLMAVAGLPPQLATAVPEPSEGVTVEPTSDRGDLAAGAYAITLLTGDQVVYTVHPDGRSTVDVAGDGTFIGESGPDGVYVVPEAAEPYIGTGLVDRELFNVRYLAEHGYHDAETDSIPVIVAYSDEQAVDPPGERGGIGPQGFGPPAVIPARPARTLQSVNAAAVAVDKAEATELWTALTGDGAGDEPRPEAAVQEVSLAEGIERVWLDRTLTVALTDSVPQTGAPAAWEAGYDGTGVTVAVLDTGVDLAHPDLSDRITATASFVPDQDVTDEHGHGTHVASTIAGSGAASGGQYVGVAPGADLNVAKVCHAGGGCLSSWIIAGMEWATVEQGANIVNISLGGAPSDGTDPLSMAVNQLTEDTGALFVISAGNSGPSPRTVTTPASADAALAVGAIDKSGQIARFSSRGPRTGDWAVKPDISAPGVAITAARAAGTGMGSPVDDHHTTASGTSMAAPHVAGAAAILAQQRPGWNAGELKAALMGAADGQGPVWEHGAGRLDIARAITQELLTDTASISPGRFTEPFDAYTVEVTYTNLTDDDRVVTLDATVLHDSVDPVEGMIAVEPATLALEGGASATATVTIDPGHGPAGFYSGQVTATTDTGSSLHTPAGFAKLSQLTVSVLPSKTGDWTLRSGLSALRVDDRHGPFNVPSRDWVWEHDPDTGVATGTAAVIDGVYQVSGTAQRLGVVRRAMQQRAYVIEPEVTVAGDTELVIDLGHIVPITVSADRPTHGITYTHNHSRTTESGVTWSSWAFSADYALPGLRLAAYPTDTKPRIGTYKLSHEHRLATSPVIRLVGGGTLTVEPSYLTGDQELPRFVSDQKLAVATMADVEAGRDVRGMLVYARAEDSLVPVVSELVAAYEAGAAGLLATSTDYPRHPRLSGEFMTSIPVLWIDDAQAQQVERFLEGGRATAAHISVPTHPSEYNLWFHEVDGIPTAPDYTVRTDDRISMETAYHVELNNYESPSHSPWCKANHTFRPEDNLSMQVVQPLNQGPLERLEYYNVTGPELLWSRSRWLGGPEDSSCLFGLSQGDLSLFAERIDGRESWFSTLSAPGQMHMPPFPDALAWFGWCAVCRQGDTLWYLPSRIFDGMRGTGPWEFQEVRLYRGDTEVAPGVTGLDFELGPDADNYRLESTHRDRFAGTSYGEVVSTAWEFTSAAPDEHEVEWPKICIGTAFFGDTSPCAYQPVIFLGYDIPLALDNTARSGRAHTFTVHAAAGRPGSGEEIEGLELQASFDDGETWADATTVRPLGDGRFQVRLRHPKLDDTAGAVSLRVHAWDGDGNTVTQTIERAYGLR